jgi:hypothetical protein
VLTLADQGDNPFQMSADFPKPASTHADDVWASADEDGDQVSANAEDVSQDLRNITITTRPDGSVTYSVRFRFRGQKVSHVARSAIL